MSSETPSAIHSPTLPICIETSSKSSWNNYNGDSQGTYRKSDGGMSSPICTDHNPIQTSSPKNSNLCSPNSSPSCAISPKIRNKFIPSDPHQECVVCHGSASGKHFGAYTCESCKLFFLRILKMRNGGRPLVCGNSNKCQVTVNTRSMCRACRFRKCCDAGMAREKCVYGRNARLIVPSSGNSTPVTPGGNIISSKYSHEINNIIQANETLHIAVRSHHWPFMTFSVSQKNSTLMQKSD